MTDEKPPEGEKGPTQGDAQQAVPPVQRANDGGGNPQNGQHEARKTAERLSRRLKAAIAELKLTDWLMVVLTAIIALSAAWNTIYVGGQLAEMRSGSQDTKNLVTATQNLVTAYNGQKDEIQKLRTATENFAKAMRDQATNTGALVAQTKASTTSAHDSAVAAATSSQAMISQAETAKREAIALERSSFAGRPYIFANVSPGIGTCGDGFGPGPYSGGSRAAGCVKFTITNYGDSPAIIESMVSDLTVVDHDISDIKTGRKLYHAKYSDDAIFLFTEPDKTISVRGGSWDKPEQGSEQRNDALVIPAHSKTVEGSQMFNFTNLPSFDDHETSRELWFWTQIGYVDIYGCARRYALMYPVTQTSETRYDTWDTDTCKKSRKTEPPKTEPDVPLEEPLP